MKASDGLFVFHADATFTFNLSFEFMDGLLKGDLVIEKLLDLSHAVAYD